MLGQDTCKFCHGFSGIQQHFFGKAPAQKEASLCTSFLCVAHSCLYSKRKPSSPNTFAQSQQVMGSRPVAEPIYGQPFVVDDRAPSQDPNPNTAEVLPSSTRPCKEWPLCLEAFTREICDFRFEAVPKQIDWRNFILPWQHYYYHHIKQQTRSRRICFSL